MGTGDGAKRIMSNTLEFGFDVGSRLRNLRTVFALSQRELARRAGMTNASLSMIEQGKVSPSLSTLEKILRAVPFSLQAFFSEEPITTTPVFQLDECEQFVKGDLQLTGWATSLENGRSLQIQRVTLAAGGSADFAFAGPVTLLMGFVISGTLSIYLEDTEYLLAEESAFQFYSERRHILKNMGVGDVILALTLFRGVR